MLALDRWALDRAAQLQDEIIHAYDNYHFHQIYQKLHNFCVVDMGGFYLDIIKDRQYTAKSDGVARRSAQTALYHLSEAFVRWISPILCFTADEIWDQIPGEHNEPVWIAHWYDQLPRLDGGQFNSADWQQVMAVKNAVNKVLEAARTAGDIGSSLDAEVVLHCAPELKELLDQLQNELRFVLITSSAEVVTGDSDGEETEVEGLRVALKASEHEKCDRCWHRREDVGTSAEHPELCGRCEENIAGEGETRLYA